MLFMTYWEVNENMAVEERIQIAQKLTSSETFPPKGVKIIRWDGTPDAWGVLIMEADNAIDAYRAIEVWRAAGKGFFKFSRTSPAVPIQELLPVSAELVEAVAAT